MTNRPEAASNVLSAIPEALRDAGVWNDIAAAHLTRDRYGGHPDALVAAVAATDAALERDPHMPEAQFNRALALERLGLLEPARAAWIDYVAEAPSDRWSVEGQAHVAALSVREEPFDGLFAHAQDALARGDVTSAEFIVSKHPSETRSRVLTETLTTWAIDVRGVEASHALAVARTIGRAFAERGDRFISSCVDRMESSSDVEKQVLASGQKAFADGTRRLKEKNPTAAEPLFCRAERLFASARSPMALTARRHLATTLYEQNRIEAAARELERLRAEIPGEYLSVRAEVLWQVGLCRSARTEWGLSIQAFRESIALFDQIGETYSAAVVRHILSQVYDAIGDPDAGWALRLVALPVLGRTTTVRTQSCLSSISRRAAEQKLWRVSAAILNIEIDIASHLDDPPSRTDALLRRAIVRHFIGRREAAAADVDAARTAIGAMADEAYRTRARADLFAVEALLAPTPSEAIRKLGNAIEFHEANGRRMYLPALHLQRGRALRAMGDRGQAVREFEAGMTELESSRENLPDIATRTGIFDAGEELFAEGMVEALARQNVSTALRYVERTRARTLLDRIPEHETAASLDRSTAIVEFAAADDRLVAFIVTHEGILAFYLDTPATMIAAEADHLSSALAHGEAEETDRLSRRLFRQLIEPASPLLAEFPRLVFVPDVHTASVRFAALRAPNGRYVIEDYTVSVAPSMAVFLRTTRKAKRDRRRLLAVAVAESESNERLDAVRKEVQAITALYAEAELLVDETATPEIFARSAPSADVIHFAGHGSSEADHAPSTSLVMGGPNGELSRARIERMSLPRTSVVVLSACNTARGTVTWSEGPLSVARAFLVAGVPSVIATLSEVEDRAAARFFVQLHRRLGTGLGPAEALRETQLEWIHRGSSDGDLWASVEAIGH